MDDSSDLFSAMPQQPKPADAAPRKPAAPAAGNEASRPAPKTSDGSDYDASAIEVLEGLEPVRRRPGMYIGGTDEKALHHLFAEVIDNSMDEAVAGHANFIDVNLDADGYLTVTDNGRGIPVENHPKFPGKSTLEVVMTCCMPAASSTARPMRPPAAFTASAFPWSTHCRTTLKSRLHESPALSPALLPRHRAGRPRRPG